MKLSTHIERCRFYIKAYRRLEIMNKAASLSYYTIISIFPMMLMVAAFGSTFLSQDLLVSVVKRFTEETLPYQSDLIMTNLTALFTKKKTFSWFGVGALLISAQLLFVNFERIVNGLLHTRENRHFLITRLLFLLWLVGLIFMLFAPLLFDAVFSRLSGLGSWVTGVQRFFAQGGFVLAGLVMFELVMLILPRRRMNPKRLLEAGLSFAVTLQLGKILFKYFTLRQFDRYNVIYGSLSSMILLTLWVFYFYNMFLFFVYWVGREGDPIYKERRATHG